MNNENQAKRRLLLNSENSCVNSVENVLEILHTGRPYLKNLNWQVTRTANHN